MKIVALYKTFSGEEFVGPSIESIYPFCDKIVFVHSNTSWTGEQGNTVAPVVEKWREEHDLGEKIVSLYTDISLQSEQYVFGLHHIQEYFPCDYVLLIDTDEVWDDLDFKKLLQYVEEDGGKSDAFSVTLHTYIKSIFYRITPPEWCQPVVLVKGILGKLNGVRGCATVNKRYLADVYMHHFTYVRLNPKEVLNKILRTAATEGVKLVDINEWIWNKWNKLPNVTNFHTVDYAITSWQSIKVVGLEDLPKALTSHPELYQIFMPEAPEVPKESPVLPYKGRMVFDKPVINTPLLELRQCSRVGVNVTWKCNWGCENCFYRFNPSLHKIFDESPAELNRQLTAAKERRCDHAVLVGYGEPTLYTNVTGFIRQIGSLGMASSIITNGSNQVAVYEGLYSAGLNHLHVSAHALGDKLDRIANRKGAGAAQAQVKKFLLDSNLPWRSNTTIQHLNYQDLPEIIEDIIDHGAFHVVLLGFLPHYEWASRRDATDVLVPPKDLRPYIEEASQVLLESKKLFTIRYHPLCHLAPELWPYVTNARYVLYDPWEWEYGHHGKNPEAFKQCALMVGRQAPPVTGLPCSECAVERHCGGWNKTYADLCDGADLRAIRTDEIPDDYLNVVETFGGLHLLNPANHCTGSWPV